MVREEIALFDLAENYARHKYRIGRQGKVVGDESDILSPLDKSSVNTLAKIIGKKFFRDRDFLF